MALTNADKARAQRVQEMHEYFVGQGYGYGDALDMMQALLTVELANTLKFIGSSLPGSNDLRKLGL